MKKIYYCKEKDCGKQISRGSQLGFCKSCSKKDKRNGNWKNTKKQRICDLCKKLTKTMYSYRKNVFCSKECKNKFHSINYKGEICFGYKNGLPKCKICNKILSAYHCNYCDDCIKKIMIGKKASNCQ